MSTKTLYRPVGQAELNLIQATNWKRFPPRLDWQPIFYPVLTEEYAVFIAQQWNTKDPNSGYVGYVLQFEIDESYIESFSIQNVGGPLILAQEESYTCSVDDLFDQLDESELELLIN